MKKILLSAILAVSGVGFAAPAMSVFTINTSDPVAYMEWARGSGKALAEINNVVSSGVCQPGYGAEEFGDMYYWSLFENHADSIGGNTADPVYIREISKIASKRTIREVDHYSVLTEASGSFETGQTFANYNINVKTKNPAAYLNGLSESVGELRRFILDQLRKKVSLDYEQLLVLMDDIYTLLAAIDYPDAITNNLRRNTDIARSIMEKTRGDLTAASINQTLSSPAFIDQHHD